MRIAHLIAGAGGMYCGACMRENRLAAVHLRQGRDVVLMPLYTPIRTDEPDVSKRRVFYGGLSVFLQQRFGLLRRSPKIMDRWLDFPPLLRVVSRFGIRTKAEDLGALTVSVLSGAHGAQRKELDKLIAGLRKVKPDLINLPNLMFAGVAGALKDALGVPILCTLAGEDVFLDALSPAHREQAFELIARESRHIDGFLAPTEYYAVHAGEHFRLSRDRLHTAGMGIAVDAFGLADAPRNDGFTMGYLAAVCPEKGLAELCEAFAIVHAKYPQCRLRIGGYVGASGQDYWREIQTKLQKQGIVGAVDFVGELDHEGKRRFLRSLHVLSVPTSHPEPKGFYVLEAMASGVPVVQPRHGSFPEIIESTGGGLLYEPGDARALAERISFLMADEALRVRLGEAGRAGVRERYTEEKMAEVTWSLYERYGSPSRP